MADMGMEELQQKLRESIETARQMSARAVGAPLVLTLEAMGYRIVPAWVVASLEKVLRGPKDSETATDAEGRG